jgi:hypothetical protein
MLEDMAAVGDESIVSWQSHGKAFRVHQPDAFARTVMPQYFKQQTKYKSFLRQLNIYGFHRIKKGMDRGAYFHSMFTRENKSMSLRMAYQKIKGKTSTNKAVDDHAAGDLDFYSSETNVNNNLTNMLQSNPILHTSCSPTISKENKKTDCSKPFLSTIVTTANHQKKHDNAGFFEGKKFFYVVEAITPMMEDSSAVVNRAGWPRSYNARSA